MRVSEELYKALEDSEKKRLEKIKEKEALIASNNHKEGEMSEEELMDLIRQIIMMRNLSKAERDEEIKRLMEKTGRTENDLSSMMAVEQLREEAEERQNRQEDEKMSEIEVSKPFSYNDKEEKEQGLYAGQVDEEYSKAGSGFQQAVNVGRSEFDDIKKNSRSEYLDIVDSDKKDKVQGPSYA
jgi:hypothetical protein